MDPVFDRVERRNTTANATPTTAAASPHVLPASEYLAEKLEQRRASTSRPRRSRHTDFGPRPKLGADDDIFLNEADEEAYNRRARLSISTTSTLPGAGAGLSHSQSQSQSQTRNRRRGSMGVRSMDEKMDKLTKENFALKLEVDQRRRQTTKMQEHVDAMTARLERFDKLQEEHAELWRINDTLVRELEKRDKAVEEAIDTICDLEDKVAELQERNSIGSVTRPSTANADSGYAGTETHEHAPQPSPQKTARAPKTPQPDQPRPNTAAASVAGNKLQNITQARTPARAKREPNILSLKKPSTKALRSVYLDNSQSLNGVKSFISLLKEREGTLDGNDDDILNSPRLSVLSESSFPSMYSPKKTDISPERFAWEAEEGDDSQQSPHPHLRQDSIKRVSQWINDGQQMAPSPSRLRPSSSSLTDETGRDIMPSSPSKRPGDEARFRSIADTLSDATTAKPSHEGFQPHVYTDAPHTRRAKSTTQRQPRPTSFAGPIFSDQLLPPTPDSVSTRMLRGSRSTMADDGSQFDTTTPAAAPVTTSRATPREPGLRTAPKQMRSSVELNHAYSSYVQRNTLPAAAPVRPTGSHLEGGDDDFDDDARSETVRDLSLDYDGFPDGQSILMGTPSRFLKHGKPLPPTPRPSASVSASLSPAPAVLFDGNDLSPQRYRQPLHADPRSPPRRRQSSSEVHPRSNTTTPAKLADLSGLRNGSNSKPGLPRMQTSPPLSISIPRPSPAPPAPPIAAASNSILSRPPSSRRPGSSSAVSMPAGPTSPSLSQRTQKLLRRLSIGTKEEAPPTTPPVPIVPGGASTATAGNITTGKVAPIFVGARRGWR